MKDESENIHTLNSYFGKKSEISLEELRYYFKSRYPDMPSGTVDWRIYKLVEDSILHRTGRGLFSFGPESTYKYQPSSRVVKIGKFLKKKFPFISFCIWDSGQLNEFAQHLSGYPFILADVEKDVAESVYFQLKEEFNGVFFRPSESLINDLLPSFRLPIIIRYLVSESPLNEVAGIPTASLEKLLVDVFCDMEFNFIEGSERRAIFGNAFHKYTINDNRLLRYAARKGKKPDIQYYLEVGNFSKH